MLKPNELRLGNLVYYGGSIRPITLILDNPSRKAVGVDNIITEWRIIKPIPLTAQILVKAGFTADDSLNDFEYGASDADLRFKLEDGVLVPEAFYTGQPMCEEAYPRYVHQLQNLIFTLTGKELELAL